MGCRQSYAASQRSRRSLHAASSGWPLHTPAAQAPQPFFGAPKKTIRFKYERVYNCSSPRGRTTLSGWSNTKTLPHAPQYRRREGPGRKIRGCRSAACRRRGDPAQPPSPRAIKSASRRGPGRQDKTVCPPNDGEVAQPSTIALTGRQLGIDASAGQQVRALGDLTAEGFSRRRGGTAGGDRAQASRQPRLFVQHFLAHRLDGALQQRPRKSSTPATSRDTRGMRAAKYCCGWPQFLRGRSAGKTRSDRPLTGSVPAQPISPARSAP
jgi:hypothetical protein